MSLRNNLFGKGKQPTGNDDTERFIGALNDHLQRVRASAPELAPFLDEHFSDAIVLGIAPTAVEKMKFTHADGIQHSQVLYIGSIVYHISTLPVDIEQAKDWFLDKPVGNYSGLLTAALDSVRSDGKDHSVWCHIVYGWGKKGSWVRMAICPIKKSAPIHIIRIPAEFLTPEERQAWGS